MAIVTPIIGNKYRPRRRDWTRQEYERATEIGLFRPEERLELIEGEVKQSAHNCAPALRKASGARVCREL